MKRKIKRIVKFFKKLARRLKHPKCLIGKHYVPKDHAFECMCALYAGGICPVCGKLKQGKFLGNVWTEERKENGIVILTGYDTSAATSQGYKVIDYIQ